MLTPGRPSCVALLWLFGAAGCWRDNPAFEYATGSVDTEGGSTGTTTASSSGPAPTSSAAGTDGGSGTTDATTHGTTDAVTSGSTGEAVTTVATGETTGTDATSTTDNASTSGADSTGATTMDPPQMCMLVDVFEPPHLLVKKNGVELLACGGAKSITNALAKFSGSTLQIYDSGNCTQSGNLYEVQAVNFTITPLDFNESCSDARIEWAAAAPCEVTAFALTNGDTPAYVGAFGRRTGPSGYEAFSVDPVFDCGCAIDQVTCCEHTLEGAPHAPGNYVLGFPGAAEDIGPQLTIAGSVDGNDYLFANLRSLVRPGCEPVPEHVWFDVRWWATLSN